MYNLPRHRNAGRFGDWRTRNPVQKCKDYCPQFELPLDRNIQNLIMFYRKTKRKTRENTQQTPEIE